MIRLHQTMRYLHSCQCTITRDFTEQMERIKLADTRVIVLFTPMEYVPPIMRDAFEVGLLEAGYAWLVVDIHEQFVSLLRLNLLLISVIVIVDLFLYFPIVTTFFVCTGLVSQSLYSFDKILRLSSKQYNLAT